MNQKRRVAAFIILLLLSGCKYIPKPISDEAMIHRQQETGEHQDQISKLVLFEKHGDRIVMQDGTEYRLLYDEIDGTPFSLIKPIRIGWFGDALYGTALGKTRCGVFVSSYDEELRYLAVVYPNCEWRQYFIRSDLPDPEMSLYACDEFTMLNYSEDRDAHWVKDEQFRADLLDKKEYQIPDSAEWDGTGERGNYFLYAKVQGEDSYALKFQFEAYQIADDRIYICDEYDETYVLPRNISRLRREP